jgi:hypothetical protein
MRRLNSITARVMSATAVRTMFVYSEQSPVLQANQQRLKSDLNVWLEDWEVKRFNLTIVQDAPTTLSLEKGLELYNFNDLVNPPEIMEMPVHTSYTTQKPYGRKLQMELSNAALKKSFTSKLWMPTGAARKNQVEIKAGARATVVLSGGSVKLYHVSQLADSEVLARWPVSGGSRRPYGKNSEQYRQLSESIALNGYKSGLFFTKKQAEALNLTPAANNVPVTLSIPADTRNATIYFNLDQLECPQIALDTLNRSEPDVPSFLMSGEPLRKTDGLPSNFKSNYWLSARDASLYNFAIKAGQENKGHVLSQRVNTIEMYHAEQMSDIAAAYKVAGHYVQ